jgi:hypothetical protein
MHNLLFPLSIKYVASEKSWWMITHPYSSVYNIEDKGHQGTSQNFNEHKTNGDKKWKSYPTSSCINFNRSVFNK